MRIALVFAFFLCFAIAVSAIAAPAQFSALVIAVADGDTITVLTQDKQQAKIRLYGIDCPESKQAFGNRAKQVTADAVHGKNVTVQPMEQDRYGRTVAVVFTPGGQSLCEHLVREGMAWVYTKYCKLKDICEPLRKLENVARKQRNGLWADKAPMPPWEWRKRGIAEFKTH